MNTLTLSIPDDLVCRLKNTAQSRGISVNRLLTEISIQALTAYDAEARFRTLAAAADIPAALKLLDRLDG